MSTARATALAFVRGLGMASALLAWMMAALAIFAAQPWLGALFWVATVAGVLAGIELWDRLHAEQARALRSASKALRLRRTRSSR